MFLYDTYTTRPMMTLFVHIKPNRQGEYAYRFTYRRMMRRVPSMQVESLTKRELEVLFWVGMGFTNLGIASRLTITEKAVEAHLRNIFGKLNAPNRTLAAVSAILNQLIIIQIDETPNDGL